MNKSDIRDAMKASQIRNSQNKQWIGQVVSADTTGGFCTVNVRGKILMCKVPSGTRVIYDSFVLVSRIPGEAHLVVDSGDYTIIGPTVKPATLPKRKVPPTLSPDAPIDLTATVERESSLVMHNHKHLLRCFNFVNTSQEAIWEEITPNGFVLATDKVCSMAMDLDGAGAWLVTTSTTGGAAYALVQTVGSGYTIGDVLTLAAPVGGTSATVTVVAIIPAGHGVLGITLTTGGSLYVPGIYSVTGGTGTGCRIYVQFVASGTAGVFHTDDITAATVNWTLVLSQAIARSTGVAYKLAQGMPANRVNNDWGELRSCVSFGIGNVCVPETAWHGISDRAPTAVFTSTNTGGSWTISIPYFNGAITQAFWASQYMYLPCHNIDFNGSLIVITGRVKIIGVEAGIYAAWATSTNGVAWTVSYFDPATLGWGLDFWSCNMSSSQIYAFNLAAIEANGVWYAAIMTLVPPVPYTGVLIQSFGFTKTIYDGQLVDIRLFSVSDPNTGLYLANSLVLVSGGASVVSPEGIYPYHVGDILTVEAPPGGTSATVRVTSINSSNGVTAVTVLTPGSGYVAGVTYITLPGIPGCCTLTGPTLDIALGASSVPPFGIARIEAADEFIIASKDIVKNDSTDKRIVSYIAGENVSDRTGNLLELFPDLTGWEGTVKAWANNGMDASGMQVIGGQSVTGVFLEWSASGANTLDYIIQRSLTSDPDDFEWLATVPVYQTSYLDTNVSIGMSYWYRVQARNASSFSAYSNIVMVTV